MFRIAFCLIVRHDPKLPFPLRSQDTASDFRRHPQSAGETGPDSGAGADMEHPAARNVEPFQQTAVEARDEPFEKEQVTAMVCIMPSCPRRRASRAVLLMDSRLRESDGDLIVQNCLLLDCPSRSETNPFPCDRRIMRVISDGTPSRQEKPDQTPVPGLTWRTLPPGT